MREILFRGKRKDNSEWIYGDLRNYEKSGAKAIFSHELLQRIMVDPKTVGQFTGLTDKNGKKIFEGDIVKLYLIDGIEIGVIKFNDIMCRYMFFTKEGSYSFDNDCIFEIIGNIHDNPELLKGGTDNA